MVINRVVNGLYIGSAEDAAEWGTLRELGITDILNVNSTRLTTYGTEFKFKWVPSHDKPDEQICLIFNKCLDFIDDAIKNGRKVMTHCRLGKSRSATIVIAYLIKYHKMGATEALTFLKTIRPLVEPNMGFIYQLDSFEKKVQQNVNCEAGCGRGKEQNDNV